MDRADGSRYIYDCRHHCTYGKVKVPDSSLRVMERRVTITRVVTVPKAVRRVISKEKENSRQGQRQKQEFEVE